jgi:ElaB/YqjD/DUF883 family membrane-anchored ribosome-binding protein
MGEGPKDLRDDAARDPRTRNESLAGPTGDDITGRPLTDLDRPAGADTLGYAGGMAPAVPSTGSGTTGTNLSGTSGDSETGDTAAIRADIEQTRANISDTVDAIQQRLSPSNVVSQAADNVRDATQRRVRQVAEVASDTASRVATTTRRVSNRAAYVARENPWTTAAAVAGVGALAWWLTSRRTSDEDIYEYDDDLLDEVSEESLYYEDFDTEEGRRLMDRMRGSAVPLIVAGAGVGWYLWSRQGHGSFRADESYDYDRSWNETEGYGADAGSYRSFDRDRDWTSADASSSTGERVRNAVSSATDRARGAVSEAGDRARGIVSGAGQRAKSVVDDVSARTRNYARSASSQVGSYAKSASAQVSDAGRRAGSQLSYWMDHNPLAVGAAAMVIGAAVGMALPESRRERRLMGETRDRLFNRAQEMAGDAVDRAKQTARDVASKATEAMNQAGSQGNGRTQASSDAPKNAGFGQNPR